MSTAEEPAGLGDRGSCLWREIAAAFVLRVDELQVLEHACREVDLVARLDDELQGAPLVVMGSQGQPVASPLVQEIRQHRALVARLLGVLKLPDEEGRELADGQARTAHARHAALARWGRG